MWVCTMLTYLDVISTKVELHILSFWFWSITIDNNLLSFSNTNLKEKTKL